MTVILEAAGITVRFGGLVALQDVSMRVPEASTVGLVGPNGAGKSTLFGVLSGLVQPNSGRVRLGGLDVTRSSPQQRARGGLARTFQHPQLFAELTVREHLLLADRMHNARRRLWTDLVTAGGLRSAGSAESARIDALIDTLGLAGVRDRLAAGLPLGICRLVEVGRALAAEPAVLLLDEASSGLDAAETAELAAALTRTVAERGISVVLVEHDVDLVFGLSDTVYVLDFGRLIAQGPPSKIREDPVVRAAYLGEESDALNDVIS
jgi:ABC-type branched-subunit amino acid transport system ATPase component